MSKETAKRLIAELQENEELKAKIAGINDPAEMAKKAVEAGYDVTLDDLIEAEKEYRAELAQKSDELTAEELEGAAGGVDNEIAKDGHEHRCAICYHGSDYEKENNDWCKSEVACIDIYFRDNPPKPDSAPFEY